MSSQEYIRSVTEMVPDEMPTFNSPETSSSSFFSNMSWKTWLIIIFILALLGINVFAYLAKGTEETASIFQRVFGPILGFFGYQTLEVAEKTVEVGAAGAKAGIDVVAGATTGAINTLQQPLNEHSSQDDSLTKALNSSQQQGGEVMTGEVMPDDSRSTIQTSGKAGWCFIGEDQGVRACSQIGVNDTCMSGDIFPTQAVCMNPNLRN